MMYRKTKDGGSRRSVIKADQRKLCREGNSWGMDKTLLRSLREYKKQSFLTPVLVAAEVFVEVLIPLLMAKIIDVGIMNGDMAYIIKLGALLVLLAVVALFFGAKAGQLAAVASSGYAKNLRHDIFYKI